MMPPPDPTPFVQGLFVQHLPELRGFVRSLLRDASLVDDVVQEVFLVVTAKAGEFQAGTNFRAWAWRIARFKALRLAEESMPASERLSAEAMAALCEDDRSQGWHFEEQIRHLAGCIEQLAPKARAAVDLRYQRGERPPHIAQALGWTVEAVNVALSRARAFLRDCVTQRLTGGNL